MSRPIEMLLIEDSPPDTLLVQRSLTRSRVLNELHCVDTGEAGLELLRARRDGAGTLPDVVLLDLKLPGIGGEDVLRAIREDPALSTVRVVVLTTSSEDETVMRSYALEADAFVEKPLDAEQLFAIMRQLEGFGVSFQRDDRRDGPP